MTTTTKNNTDLKNIVISHILTSLNISRNATLYIQENEVLSIKGLAKSHTAITNTNHAMRAAHILKDMLSGNIEADPSHMNYCSINGFFTALVRELNSLFASGSDISFIFNSKLAANRTFYIDINKMEAVLFALIHCLVKNSDETDKREIKISIDEKSDRSKRYNITISSRGKTLESRLSGIFSKKSTFTPDFYDLDALSLLNARENAKLLSGTISYSGTKTMNKFLFTVPYISEFDTEYHEIIKYNPDTCLMKAYFYEFLIG